MSPSESFCRPFRHRAPAYRWLWCNMQETGCPTLRKSTFRTWAPMPRWTRSRARLFLRLVALLSRSYKRVHTRQIERSEVGIHTRWIHGICVASGIAGLERGSRRSHFCRHRVGIVCHCKECIEFNFFWLRLVLCGRFFFDAGQGWRLPLGLGLCCPSVSRGQTVRNGLNCI